FFDELSGPPFSRARRRRPSLSLGRGLDAEPSLRCDRSLSVLSSCFQPGSARLSSFHCAAYGCTMNPLPNEWSIKHRADACAVTHRPFAAGEYFYTLLFHDADGYRREDLAKRRGGTGMRTFSRFHFGNHVTSL